MVDPGPFSAFPGVDRTLVLIEGTGLSLAHAETGAGKELRPLQPYAFSGDLTTSCTLDSGPVRDLGVMVRRGCFQARVRVLRPARPLTRVLRAPLAFACYVRGQATLGVGQEIVDLQAGETLRVEGAAGPAPALTAVSRSRGTALVLVLLERTSRGRATPDVSS